RRNGLNRLIRCVCGKKIGPDPRNFNQRVSLGRNDLLIRTFPKRALFKNMKKVGIHLVNDVITIRPSFHEKLEAWSGNRINESDYVVLPADSSPTEIGSGLRLALSRCKG
ncbi:TPA: contact-dependent growth inhibition system immunity protein, partial [Escherichia coli]